MVALLFVPLVNAPMVAEKVFEKNCRGIFGMGLGGLSSSSHLLLVIVVVIIVIVVVILVVIVVPPVLQNRTEQDRTEGVDNFRVFQIKDGLDLRAFEHVGCNPQRGTTPICVSPLHNDRTGYLNSTIQNQNSKIKPKIQD